MYTLLVKENNEIVTTVRERIMQRSKLVDNLHILVEPMYKNHDMSTFTVMLEYMLPVSQEYKSEILVQSEEQYKNMLEFTLPFDTCLTKESGRIEIQLTFVKVEMDDEGNVIQRVRKAGPAAINIIPVTAWSSVIPDSALSAIDQRLVMAEAMINAANDTISYLDETKADDITFDKETQTLQLVSNGNLIGNRVSIPCSGSGIASIYVDADNNLIIKYSDGRQENVGQISGDACVGTYVPSYSEDGILTFTLSENVTDEVLSFDINTLNDWNTLGGPEEKSSYIWQQL